MSMFLRYGVFALLAMLAFSAPAQAARLYFTTTNTLPGGGSPVAEVPSIDLANIGDTVDLYVWVDLDTHNFMSGYGLDITASTPGIVEAVTSELYNAGINAPNFGNAKIQDRWKDGFRQPDVNPNGSGTALLASNARGLSANLSGSAGIFAKNQTYTDVFPAAPVVDTMYDATNDVFLAQKITLRSIANGNTGIVMRIGDNAFSLNNSTVAEPIFFGAGTTSVPNAAVGQTDGTMHAMIQVGGGGGGDDPTIAITTHPGTDLTGDVVFNSEGFSFRNAGGITEGRINIVNYLGDGSGDLPLFFDLVDGGAAQALVDALNANANGAYVAALSTFSAPNAAGGSSTADVMITYSNIAAGTSQFIDFDFGAVAVAAVGVPEPSSIALVGMSVLGLVGYGVRRRRLA